MRLRALFLLFLAFWPLSDELTGFMGRGLYAAGAKLMQLTHDRRSAEPLDDRVKAALRPSFGALVDRVRVIWDAIPLDRWSPVQPGGTTLGMTFGHEIYIAYPRPVEWSESDLELILHELVHTRQFEELGHSFSEFGYRYFKGWARAGFQYFPNRMEAHARDDAHRHAGEAWERYKSHTGPLASR